jgi:hypothetical protein
MRLKSTWLPAHGLLQLVLLQLALRCLSVLSFASPRQWLNPWNAGCSYKDYVCYLLIMMQLVRFLDHFMLWLAFYLRHLRFLIRPTLWLLPH